MLALQKVRPGPGLELREIESVEAPASNEVLIEVEAAGVCGSDLHVYEWSDSYAFMDGALPVTIGHEFAGRIVQVGADVASEKLAKRVTVMPSIPCGTCSHCATDRAEACRHRTGIGLTRAGAFTRLVRVPAANCIELPNALSAELAALTEPFTVGAQAVDVARLVAGAHVLVLGPGTIGQTIALMAREAGAALVAVAGFDDPTRLRIVGELGFEHRVDLARHDLARWATTLLGAGERFDVVFEATGAARSIHDGLSILRFGGVLVSLGIHKAPVAIDVTRLIRYQQQIRGSHRAPRATWPRVVAFLAREGERLEPMISHRFTLRRAIEGFELARRKEASKVMLLPASD